MVSKDIGMYSTCKHFCVHRCHVNIRKECVLKMQKKIMMIVKVSLNNISNKGYGRNNK